MSETQDATFRKWATAVMVAATLAYAGWLGSAMLAVGNRLTSIETVIAENREVRQSQITDLRSRMQRLEGDVYFGRRP